MFWTKYRKNAGPESLHTDLRITVEVTPELAAYCLLYYPDPATSAGEEKPERRGLDPDTGETMGEWTPDRLREWASTRTEEQIRAAVEFAVRDRGAGEPLYLYVTETDGWPDEHINAVTEGVAQATINAETWARLFPRDTGALP